MPNKQALVVIVDRNGHILKKVGYVHAVSDLFGVQPSALDAAYASSINRVRVAVDRSDNIYVAFLGAPVIEKYSSTGVLLGRFSCPDVFRRRIWHDFISKTGHHARLTFPDAPSSIPDVSTGLAETKDGRLAWVVTWDRTTLHILPSSLAADSKIDLGTDPIRDIAAGPDDTSVFGIGGSIATQNIVYRIDIPARSQTAGLNEGERR